ncbi:MAG: YicC/YloC family endoribonuclease [Cyclobacteriaceae bacterium]
MQQSMTGYGRDERNHQQFQIKTEIKSLNSKFLDLTARYGKELSMKEIDIRNLISDKLKRGKIMLSIDLAITEVEESSVQVDDNLFKAYFKKFESLASTVGHDQKGLFEMALQAPDVIKQQELDAELIPWSEVFKSIENAANQCAQFRKEEGNALEQKLSEYALNIAEGLEAVEAADESRSENVRSRLQKNLDEIRDKVQVDENRFEQELIYYLEKLDITEEKVRLNQHLSYFQEVLEKEDQAGKKLGFIAQEIGREINTIGSKANDADVQRTVVRMKDELEKIKEQTLNIL